MIEKELKNSNCVDSKDRKLRLLVIIRSSLHLNDRVHYRNDIK